MVTAGKERSAGELELTILERAQAGDREAQEAFVRHYQRSVFAFLSRNLGRDPRVEDLAQEVFLRALRALPSYRVEGSKLTTWLFKIVVRLSIDESRKRRPTLLAECETVPGGGHSPEQALSQRQTLSLVEQLAARLPEEQRIALVLRHFHQLSYEQIGEVTGAGVRTVKTRIHRARRALQRGLAAVEGSTPGGGR
jgi:RNA polymerase sigma-70 factor (ECF subfamily)